MIKAEYILNSPDEVWWCNSHQRRATHVCVKTDEGYFSREPVCDPKLPGIMLPCFCVHLTHICELVEVP